MIIKQTRDNYQFFTPNYIGYFDYYIPDPEGYEISIQRKGIIKDTLLFVSNSYRLVLWSDRMLEWIRHDN